MSTESGPSGTSAAGETLEVAHFTPEQLVLIDRLIAARVASPSTPEDGSGAGPSATSSSASIGECLPPNAHALHAPWAGTGLPLPRGDPMLERAVAHTSIHSGTSPLVYRRPALTFFAFLQARPPRCLSSPCPRRALEPRQVPRPAQCGHQWCHPQLRRPSAALGELPGFGSVPPRLIKKILAKEYVDIWELLPETWQVETEGSCCHSKRPRRSLVTDINVWTECFATMVAILAAAFPAKAPHYLRTITKASRTFECSAWVSYDMAFRRQAANHGSLDWGHVDAALYNEAFAGRAKQIPRCRYCLADTHFPGVPARSGGRPHPDGEPLSTARPAVGGGRPRRVCRRYLPPVQLPGGLQVPLRAVPLRPPVHPPAPSGGVWREATADT